MREKARQRASEEEEELKNSPNEEHKGSNHFLRIKIPESKKSARSKVSILAKMKMEAIKESMIEESILQSMREAEKHEKIID